MSKQKALSGFPEWLPEQELVQQQILDTIQRCYTLHGFAPLRTRAVEPLSVLLAKGETSKEVYVLSRLQAEEREPSSGYEEDGLGLHFDLTVPFARYVVENRGRLSFPYRRYQVQPVWRGERPQLGRYREFIQADVDIIGSENLHVRHDAEVVRVIAYTLGELPVPTVLLQVNNRKVLEGLYRGLGIEDIVGTLQAVDKLDKVGPDGVSEMLAKLGHSPEQVAGCLAAAQLPDCTDSASLVTAVRDLGIEHPLLDEGLDELCLVLDSCQGASERTRLVAALRVARGLDYYTGTVLEGVFAEHPDLGSICGGGRYEDLAGSMAKVKLPGVGASIGVTRILGFCFKKGLLETGPRSPAQVMVVVHHDKERGLSEEVAAALRARGLSTLVSHRAKGYGKQIQWAAKMGIPYVWMPGRGDQGCEVKDIRSGEQVPADRDSWLP